MVSTTATAPCTALCWISQLLAEVYIELIGGKQAALGLTIAEQANNQQPSDVSGTIIISRRPIPLRPRLTEAEKMAHAHLVEKIGDKAIWNERIASAA